MDLDELLKRLRGNEPLRRAGLAKGSPAAVALGELASQGVRMAATGGSLEETWHRAIAELAACIQPGDGGPLVLQEGGVYRGTWLESTGTISAEVLGRFLPTVARDTYLLFADRVRADGLLPYKVTGAGPAYRHIQIVSPLARSVWNHYQLAGRDRDFLRRMYSAMERNDFWLARHRDTRGTGCVEAFCTFDTGHDGSPRFWHVPDTTHGEDPAHYHPDSPVLPYVAPDLTANVACQRRYLAEIVAELGENDPTLWSYGSINSFAALFEQCYDEVDGTFYDRDRTGAFVRVQSDVLLRVLACEAGDGEFFTTALRRHLLNTRKFFARYPFTSIALDDPRFDHDVARNSWAGPTNFLSVIRAPHAFERHGRHVELSWALIPVLAAVSRMDRFPQTLNPWSGDAGYTEQYSPAILWTLDAVERLAGIMPRAEGEVWFTALLPYGVDHQGVADAVAYGRSIDSSNYEFVHDETSAVVYRDGGRHAEFPHGWRLVTDRAGTVLAIVGLSARTVFGTLVTDDFQTQLAVAPNERVELDARGGVTSRLTVGLVQPTH